MEVYLNVYLKNSRLKLNANYYIVLLIFCMMLGLSTFILWAECFSLGSLKKKSYLNKQEDQ